MKRLTQGTAEDLADAAERTSSFASDLHNAIQEWIEAKEEGNSEEAREAAAMAREEIASAIDELEVALGDLGYSKEASA